MALVFSPLSEEVLDQPPRILFPQHAFIMRQLGTPPQLDEDITSAVCELLMSRGFGFKDADSSVGRKDFLERILGLIRATGLTIAIFTHQTRPSALANIMLELDFAAMCGKPIMIVKSLDADAPSDLKRTDWINFDPANPSAFARKVHQALDQIEELANFEELMLDVALEAELMDCAVAFERVQRAFLITGAPALLVKAERILTRLASAGSVGQIDDLSRLRNDVSLFVRQGGRAKPP